MTILALLTTARRADLTALCVDSLKEMIHGRPHEGKMMEDHRP